MFGKAQVELWARGIVPDHEALVRFFAEWQAWERQEIAADRIPTVLERRTYCGADLLARYQEWQAQRGSCGSTASGTISSRRCCCPSGGHGWWRWARLRDLQQLVYAISDSSDTAGFCANATWHGGTTTRPPVKAYLSRLVVDSGFATSSTRNGHDSILCTSTAFDAAQDALYELLPLLPGRLLLLVTTAATPQPGQEPLRPAKLH